MAYLIKPAAKGAVIAKETLCKLLRSGYADVTFTKVNGDPRLMRCTLDPINAPEGTIMVNESETPIKSNLDVIRVWDMDKKDWRSIRLDSIKQIVYHGELD